MTAVTAFLRLLTFTLFLATSVQLPQLDGCSPVLVEFSACLQYVSATTNNTTETVPSHCCDAVNSAFSSGHGDCLCEPLRKPLIFGFPLNETRIRSLSSVCHTSGAPESICSSGSLQTYLTSVHGGTIYLENPKPPYSDNKQLFPIPETPNSDSQPHLPIPKPSNNHPQLPIPEPPDNHTQLPIPKPSDIPPQLPIPKPSDSQPQLPIPKPSNNQSQLPIPKPSDNQPQLPLPPLPFPKPSDSGKQPQLPLPPLPFPKPSDSGKQPHLPLAPLPLPKPSDSGQLPHLPLPPFHGTTGPEIPKTFDPAPTTSSPATPSSSVVVSRGSIAATIFKSNSWFLPGILISVFVFVHA